jgi:cobaltochelatase CobS
MSQFLGWEYVEVNCNQFTSPLELIGGQTIEGYQMGKLEMAWTNVTQSGRVKGCVLCLDELPKLDPNTAGVLNAALAKTKQKGQGKDPFIYNGKGDKCVLGNLFVIATGNTQLNDTSPEYEANFKQDLSLQDRFVGSTYKVIADYQSEYEVFMKGVTFIWLYLIKLREKIMDRGLTGVAFVSIRIMMSLKDTYLVYRTPDLRKINADYAIKYPKTLKDGLDEFLNLFTEAQQDELRDETNYDEFVKIIKEKDKLPIDKLDTREEVAEAQKIIRENLIEQGYINT